MFVVFNIFMFYDVIDLKLIYWLFMDSIDV